MRLVFLDTETTGLDPNLGHRIIEIAAVEMLNRRLTGNHFHCYLNPERDIDPGAQQVHGITADFLQDKPLFRDIVRDFLEYVSGAELIIHNAPFDVGFLDCELGLLQLKSIERHCAGVTDTLRMAKELHPGQKNNLNALCRRYQVDNSGRVLHGALLDAELLADVYLALTRGQDSLMIEGLDSGASPQGRPAARGPRPELSVLRASPDELEAHRLQLEEIDRASKGGCLWKALAAPALQS